MNLTDFKKRIILIRGREMILDRDVADYYKVEVKRVNESARKYRNKFPEGYILQLTADEWNDLKLKDSSLLPAGRGRHPKFIPKAFSEKAVYMMGTILKSPISTNTTITIVESFSKMRQLSKLINEVGKTENQLTKKALLRKSNALLKELLIGDFHLVNTENNIKLNISVVKQKEERGCKKN